MGFEQVSFNHLSVIVIALVFVKCLSRSRFLIQLKVTRSALSEPYRHVVELACKYTLSKCPSGHPILHQGLTLNSKNSVGKYKKIELTADS